MQEALHMLRLLDQRGIRLNSSIYDSWLRACLSKEFLPAGKLLHAHMIATGFKPDIFLGTKLVIMYGSCGYLSDSRRVLNEMPEQNVVSWTAIIGAHARHGSSEEALILFFQMQRTGIQPNQFTFASVLPACADLASLEQGKKFHEDIIRSGFLANVFVGSALVDMYCKCGSIEDARLMFDKLPARNVVSWNSMIAGYAQNGLLDEALKLFQQMPERNVVSWNTMIAGYAQNGHVDEAMKLFQKIPQQNVVSWNSMIAGYAQNGYIEEAVKLFQNMPDRNVVSWNSMIAGYAQNGCVNEALKLFQEMPERNLLSWNSMIAGFEQNGNGDKALRVFRQMQLAGVKPNSVTFASVLPACANLAALEYGKEVHEDIIRSRFQPDIVVENALVDMYAKCGSIEFARKVFEKMPERVVVSWNAIIVGYAMHGYGKEAIQLFEQMQHSGSKANHVTFVGVLSACCHAGLVSDGWKYFQSMSRDYYITPVVEHYCCMVDLLGRAGCLDEAEDFIHKMPIKPNAAVWRSLLGACRIHNNIEVGERVAEILIEIDPKNPAHYVMLSNIYAAASRWDGVEKVRKMMKNMSIKKMPGCSWIDVNNKMYGFHVGD
eukprot:Gb_14197 [translate_table: standard]